MGKQSESFDRCARCGEWGFTISHHCPPLWLVSLEDSGDWVQVFASDEETAATKFCERYDADVSNWPEGRTVYVKKDDSEALHLEDAKTIAYAVTCEAVPSYHAERIQP